jgi:hypothetical protein
MMIKILVASILLSGTLAFAQNASTPPQLDQAKAPAVSSSVLKAQLKAFEAQLKEQKKVAKAQIALQLQQLKLQQAQKSGLRQVAIEVAKSQ